VEDAGAMPVSRIALDGALCTASGVCVGISPELFSLPSGAYCAALRAASTDDPALIAAAREAAEQCPTQAITVTIEADG
jgi:ferredoxin